MVRRATLVGEKFCHPLGRSVPALFFAYLTRMSKAVYNAFSLFAAGKELVLQQAPLAAPKKKMMESDTNVLDPKPINLCGIRKTGRRVLADRKSPMQTLTFPPQNLIPRRIYP